MSASCICFGHWSRRKEIQWLEWVANQLEKFFQDFSFAGQELGSDDQWNIEKPRSIDKFLFKQTPFNRAN